MVICFLIHRIILYKCWYGNIHGFSIADLAMQMGHGGQEQRDAR